MKQVTLSFPRTIYRLKGETSFLDPWSSLNTKTTYQHLHHEILLTIGGSQKALQVRGPPQSESDILRHWILVLPRRNYTPPRYPHLQLWYLSKCFTPTLSLLPQKQLAILPLIIRAVRRAILSWQRQQNLAGRFVFGINATPFAFIRRPDGSYWPGGQSVRAFHLSCLLLPLRRMMEKQAVAEDKMGLIYPSDFALNLLKFWFYLPNLRAYIFPHSHPGYVFTKRGLIVKFSGTNGDTLVDILAFLRRFDQIAYQVQLILIRSLYRKSEHFLEALKTLLVSGDTNILKDTKNLHLRFRGNPPAYALESIWVGLRGLNLAYGRRRSPVQRLRRQWGKVSASLTLNKQEEPASFLRGVSVILRPGMGYGYLVEEGNNKMKVWIMPLDTLFPKGIIEARGFSFSKKIVRHQAPEWLLPLRDRIKHLLLQPTAG